MRPPSLWLVTLTLLASATSWCADVSVWIGSASTRMRDRVTVRVRRGASRMASFVPAALSGRTVAALWAYDGSLSWRGKSRPVSTRAGCGTTAGEVFTVSEKFPTEQRALNYVSNMAYDQRRRPPGSNTRQSGFLRRAVLPARRRVDDSR